MTKKYYNFTDVQVIHKGKTYYLRLKIEKRARTYTPTIRTQRDGKGTAVMRFKPVLVDDPTSYKEMLRKVNARFKIQIVQFVDIEDI